MLIGLMFNLGLLQTKVFAITDDEKLVIKVREGINKLGIGIESKVKVKLKDKTEIKGYISEISDNGFTVVDKNNISNNIPYPQVKQVKGNNLSKGARIAIGIGVILLIGLFYGLVVLRDEPPSR
jgi:hypothetical protein